MDTYSWNRLRAGAAAATPHARLHKGGLQNLRMAQGSKTMCTAKAFELKWQHNTQLRKFQIFSTPTAALFI